VKVMYMKEADICREYRQAKDKQKQIAVLADMNVCTQAEIIALLIRRGEQVKGMGGGKGGDTMKGRSWDTEKAMALYNEGKTDRQIAEAVFVSPGVVGVWRRKQGLPSNRENQEKQNAVKAPEPPEPTPTVLEPPASAPPSSTDRPLALPRARGPVELSVELNGCAFALRAPDLEGAAWAYEYAGRLLDDMRKAAEHD